MPQTGNYLIDRCASELNRSDLSTSGSFYEDSKVLLNDTLRDLLNRYSFSWRILDPPLEVSTADGQKTYDISTTTPETGGIQEVYAIVLDTGTTQTYTMRELLLSAYLDKWANVDYLGTAYPEDYAKIDKHKFVVGPRPSSSSWKFKVYYTRNFFDITNFDANLEVHERALEVVKVGLLARMYRWTHEYQTAAGFFAIFEAKIGELISRDKLSPAREMEMQPAVFGDRVPLSDYWKSPFIRGV